jgi:N-acetylglutamate synthase-like GNAT family acetyltransferase
VKIERVSDVDLEEIRAFLREADLTLAGLEAPTVQLWIERDKCGEIVGSAGFELSANRKHALIRSVAVAQQRRSAGAGSRLAKFALERAHEAGATRAWLFSRRSGPFWQNLGFTRADREQLAATLPDTHQVLLFVETGQLDREVAWSRSLSDDAR